jgi:hypothetical protein
MSDTAQKVTHFKLSTKVILTSPEHLVSLPGDVGRRVRVVLPAEVVQHGLRYVGAKSAWNIIFVNLMFKMVNIVNEKEQFY